MCNSYRAHRCLMCIVYYGIYHIGCFSTKKIIDHNFSAICEFLCNFSKNNLYLTMFPIKPMVFKDSKYDYPSFFSYLNNFDFCELKMTEKHLNECFESDDSTVLIRYSFGILSAILSIHINHDWCH